MKVITEKLVTILRQQFPKGTRIRLGRMDDSFNHIPPGTIGTVELIDDIGTIHCAWDNGSTLGLIIYEDRFTVVSRPNNMKEESLCQ